MASIPIASAVGSGAIALATITVYIWRKYDNFDENYLDKADTLQDEAWSEMSSELRKLFEDVEEKVDNNPDGKYEDLSRADQIEFFIQEELDRGELNPIEDSLEEIDEPKKLYQDARAALGEVVKRFGITIVVGILAAFLFAVDLNQDTEGLRMVVALVAVSYFALGFDQLRAAMNLTSELDEMWEDYYFE